MSDVPSPFPAPPSPSSLSLSVGMEVVTRRRLRLADAARDARLGSLAGRYELAAVAWTGEHAQLVAFYEPPPDAAEARTDLEQRCQEAATWGVQRLRDQGARDCEVLLVALHPVDPPQAAPAQPDQVRIGVVAVDPAASDVIALLPVPKGLISAGDIRRHLRRLRDGAEPPTLAAVDLAERQTVAGGYATPARRALVTIPWATYTLLGLCVAVWLLEEGLVGTLRGGLPIGLEDFGAAVNSGSGQWDWWRFISASFIHATTHGASPQQSGFFVNSFGIYHILGNSLALFFFGRFCEQLYGRLVMVAVFLLTGAGGLLAWEAVTAVGLATANVVSFGASAGIAGLLGFMLVIGRAQGRGVPAGVVQSVRSTIVRNLVFAVVFWFFLNGTVNNEAHIGGALTGALLGLVLPPLASVGGRDLRRDERIVLGAVVAIAGVAVVVAGAHLGSVLTLPAS